MNIIICFHVTFIRVTKLHVNTYFYVNQIYASIENIFVLVTQFIKLSQWMEYEKKFSSCMQVFLPYVTYAWPET